MYGTLKSVILNLLELLYLTLESFPADLFRIEPGSRAHAFGVVALGAHIAEISVPRDVRVSHQHNNKTSTSSRSYRYPAHRYGAS